MNEQQLADLFSEQIDRVLAGEPATDLPAVDELRTLVGLGQNLSRISFQPGPAAQIAFQSQLAIWFGTSGSSVPAATLGLSKGLSTFMVIVGLGIIALVGSIWLGLTSEADPHQPADTVLPAAGTLDPVGQPAPTMTPSITVTVKSDEEAVSTTPARPTTTSNSLGDTLPVATRTPATQPAAVPGDSSGDSTAGDKAGAGQATGKPAENMNSDGSNGGPPKTDRDRGHGNDPDRHDEDNPGGGQGNTGSKGSNGDKKNGGERGKK